MLACSHYRNVSKQTTRMVNSVHSLEHYFGRKERGFFYNHQLVCKGCTIQPNIKTLREIYDMGSNEIADDYLHGFILPYAMYNVGQIHSLDSPADLFVNHIRSSFDCDFVSLDPRINSRRYTIENSFTLGSTEEVDPKKSPYYKVVCVFDSDKVTILQSCNGLLLCTSSRRHAFDYVYNPSTNLLKILLEPDYANVDSNVYGCAGLRLTFDPKKSPYYKVVRAGHTCSDIIIQI
uniref:Uncharacterized protein n=1 Tax=Tanacetum cinerariifolium TaxID=118510 RepID=A0A699HG31_TANCI|nr:hypothetical protein [Tanacetum cinerariifolium]